MLRHLLLAALCATLLSGCLEVESNEIIPGDDFTIVDAYFEQSQSNYSSYITVVVKNNRSISLPTLYVDYNLVCNNGYKKYATTYFSLSSNEQDSESFYVGSDATSCTYTITAVRPYADNDYSDWTGSFEIQIP
ncbi:hypothetical protein [Hallerella succinigenes]|uniref:Lipoprotein n=1 Tax=Hallerella succinigenes TaxID=1896222 RepID=A0A2M9A9W2_9BACT|nr:hypothetical protein [Hallerella succinigenes]PJJ42474.1 hypothetical protein BGX16_2504 [Hallerella succinigenes]